MLPRHAARRTLRALATLAALAALLACGAPASTCPAGQDMICARMGDCRCGPICNAQEDCTGRDVCARFRGRANEPGVCVDVLWAFDSPCVPLCSTQQVCVTWSEGRSSCSNRCARAQDCSSNCCVQVRDGAGGTFGVCGEASVCRGTCNPPCTGDDLCVLFAQPTCARRCETDGECAPSCCLGLEGGGGVCAPMGMFCPSMPRPACRTMEACTSLRTSFRAASTGACGSHGAYEAAVGNYCDESVACRVCWWSPATRSYSDCAALGELPVNATVPGGDARCASEAFPDPPARIRCVDLPSYFSGFDCLGTAPL